MKNSVLKTALIASLFTAIGVSALSYFVMPRLFPAQQQLQLQPGMGYTVTTDPNMVQPGVMQPVVYAAPAQQPYYAPRPVYRRAAPARVYNSSASVPDYSSERERISEANPNAAPYGRDANGEPIVKRDRSFGKSAMIVGATAGTGAAIGALAGGGKGAGIGALAGGVGGFIYDRMTAHPKQPNYYSSR